MDAEDPPTPLHISPTSFEPPERLSFLDDPEHPRMERIFSDADTWGGLWDPSNDEDIKLTIEPRKTKTSAALMQWVAFQEQVPLKDIAPVADIYLNRYSQSWFGRPIENPIEYFNLIQNNFQEQRNARSSFNDLLAEGAKAALGSASPPASHPPNDTSASLSPDVLPFLASERMVHEWRVANPEPAARIPEKRALSDMQILLDEISKTSEQQKSDVRELVSIMAHRSGKKMTSELPPVSPEAEARLMDRLTDMPFEDRQHLYDLASLLGKGYGAKTNGIIDENLRRNEQMVSVTGRAIAQPVRQVGRTADFMNTQRRLIEMRAGLSLYVSPTSPDDPILYSDLQMSIPDASIPQSYQPRPTIPSDWVLATDEQRKKAIARTERNLRSLQVERELDYVIADRFDPMEPVPVLNLSDRKDWVGFVSRTRDKGEQALYDAASSVPSLALAASGYGIPALVVAQTSQTFDETLASNPDANPDLAMAVASGTVVVNVALERVKLDALLERYRWLKPMKADALVNRYPWLKSLQKLQNDQVTPGSRAFNIALRGSAVLGKEYIAENAQNIVAILGRQLLEELDPKVKNVPIEKALDDLFASQERILFALLPFVALASGRIGLHEMRNYNELLRNPKNLYYLGLSEDQITRITSEPNPGKASAILQEEYAKTTQQDRQKGVKVLVEDEKSARETWSVRLKDEEIFSTIDKEEANTYASQINEKMGELSEDDILIENNTTDKNRLARKVSEVEIKERKDWHKIFKGPAKIVRIGVPIREIFGSDVSDLFLTQISGAPRHAVVLVEGKGRRFNGSLTFRVIAPEIALHTSVLASKKNGEITLGVPFMKTRHKKGKGYGAHSFARAKQAAERIGVKEIKLLAIGNAEDIKDWSGYYAWATYGFDAPLPTDIIDILPPTLSKALRLSDLMMTQEGRDFWKAKGGITNMIFNLSPDSPSNKVFEDHKIRNDYDYREND